MTKVTLLKGTAAINKAIASIATRGAKLDASIQLTGLSILAHVEEHGDTTLADRLFNAMPKGSRRVMLAEWFLAFGLMRTLSAKNKDDAIRIKGGAVFGIDRTRRTDMAGAEAKPWYAMKKERAAAEAFDAQASVKAVLARLTKAAAGGLEIQHREGALAAAKALVEALEG